MAGSGIPLWRRRPVGPVLRGAYVAIWVAAIGYLAVRVERLVRLRAERQRQVEQPAAERLLPNDSKYVLDDLVGWRPRGRFSDDFHATSIDGARRLHYLRRTDSLGLVRHEELPPRLSRPTVLVVDDSHLFGIVSNAENAATLLQSGLRRLPGGAKTTVVNASSGYYSPYQYLLRIRQLHRRVRPQLVIAVIYMGNDLIELEDVGRPHIDDDGVERPAAPAPPPPTTSARMDWLQPVKPGLFWQGLNQSAYLLQRPGRRVAIERKLRVVCAGLHELGRAQEWPVLAVLLPSYELAYPQRLESLPANARAAMEYTRSLDLPGRVSSILAQEGIDSLDLTQAFARADDPDIYADDYHIWRSGHALLAAEVTPVAARALGLTAAQ